MERVILHCDANAFYASVECLYTPSIRHRPVAVCGSVEERHGIVLTKNQVAKQFGVQTGEAIWQARQKCPDLICVPPDYALYIRFSRRMRRLYEEYSDRVESFGLDEAWIDLSTPGLTIRDGERIGHEIRLRVKHELGITVSVGVSFNKIFAKLGSDMKKPDAVTVISQDSFRDMVWPLPVGDLLFVGPATRRRLADMNVRTIGDLARFEAECLRSRLGKPGLMLKAYAAGLDRSPVMPADERMAIQSIGNSTTPPHDLETMADARCLYYLLAESVAARLRQEGLRARAAQATASLGARRPVYQTVLPRFSILDGKCAELELLPVDLGLDGPKWEKGVPRLADARAAEEICAYLNRVSAPYGTRWRVQGQAIVQTEGGKA